MNLNEPRPTIVVDTREQTPLIFPSLPTTKGTLRSGDYSILGLEELFSIERKSINDLVCCCTGDNRRRFEAELHRLRGYRFKRLVIVGRPSDVADHRYRSQISPAAVLGSISSFEVRYDIPVIWCPTPELAANRIETWATYFCNEILKVSQGLVGDATADAN